MVFGFRFNREEDKMPAKTPEQLQEFLAAVNESFLIDNAPVEAPLRDRLVMIVRDPRCIFSYIDPDSRTKDKIRAIYGEEAMGYMTIKKVYPLIPSFLIPGKKYAFKLRLNDVHPNFYFTEGIEPGKEYQSKFKIKGIEPLVSNIVETPVNYMSSDTSCEFADQRELLLK
jgi:hypothetical protein